MKMMVFHLILLEGTGLIREYIAYISWDITIYSKELVLIS